MKFILSVKNKIEEIYNAHPVIWMFVVRVIFSMITLYILKSATGYNSFISSELVIVLFSLICGFIPIRALMIVYIAYIAVQLVTLSTAIGIVIISLLLIMYLLYFRLEPGYGYVLIMFSIFSIIRVPLLIVLILAVTTPFYSIFAVMFGSVTYYLIRYVNINAAVYSGLAETPELTKIGMFISGFFTYREFLMVTVVVIIVFTIVYFIKKINTDNSNNVAIMIGTGTYLILIILSNLILSTMTSQRLIYAVVGSIISGLIAMVVVNAMLPLDYSRTQQMEFQDDEYYYFVRAVPKAAINKKSVRVKRISRRLSNDSIGKGDNS